MSGECPVEVELVADADCPHLDRARDVLARALAEVGRPRRWIERIQPPAGAGEPTDGESRLPSPSILVDGEDVEGPVGGTGCRLYTDADGRLVGVPPVAVVVGALRGRETRDGR